MNQSNQKNYTLRKKDDPRYIRGVKLVQEGTSYISASKKVGLSLYLLRSFCKKLGVQSVGANDPNKVRAAKIGNKRWKNIDPTLRKVYGDRIKKSYTKELRNHKSELAILAWQTNHEARMIANERGGIKRIGKYQSHNKGKFTNAMSKLRFDLWNRASSCCEECGISEQDYLAQNGRRLSLHHLSYDRAVPQLKDVRLLCGRCHHQIHTPNEEQTPNAHRMHVIKAVGLLLERLGVDLLDDNFMETPRRFGDYLLQHFISKEQFEVEVESFASAVFPAEYDGMVIQSDIRAFGICPHHLLPIVYSVDFGYIPRNSAIGLSKISRLVELYAKLPLLQEFFTKKLAVDLSKWLGTPDIALVVRGKHQCMHVRGVKAHDAETTTSSLLGAFYNKPEAREEFTVLRKL